MKEKIWLSSPHMSGNEMKYVNEAFDTNWIAPLGPNVTGFENELADYLGINNVAALSSGTSAIHLALILLGVKPGDEVIASSFTFSATVNPIAYLGAVPVLIDSEEETWNMSPELLEKAIIERIEKGKKPKAVIVVHLYGMPAKIVDLISIANKYDIPVIDQWKQNYDYLRWWCVNL
jgi:dTDP-4-amino-4,6-dideoxygalactose transaminase